MRFYGDITGVSGYELEPVDVVTGGSPCQDLSIAGKRAGLAGERSGLFMEQMRVVKELRDADRKRGKPNQLIQPRYHVWENVCFGAGTLVTCENGYKPIEKISIGDKVKTFSGSYKTVCRVHKTAKQKVLRLKASGGEDLLVTPNHPFWARRKDYKNKERKSGGIIREPEWVRASELTGSHLIAYKIDIPTLPENFMSEAEAWAVGRWLAGGSVDLKKSNPRIFISCGIKKAEYARQMLEMLPYAVHENSPHKTAINFCFTSNDFYSFIAEAGIGAGNKKVPQYVFELPQRLKECVVNGYISGDGNVRVRGNGTEISASTASRELAYGIARLMRDVYRVSVNIQRREPKGGKIGERILHANYPCYSINASITSSVATGLADDYFVWQSVKSVEPVENLITVFNISVLEENTYAANDIVVHNCGAFSSNGGRDFQAVLTETVRIAEPGAPDVPLPDKGKWPLAGLLLGEHWSVAWRAHDAQWWGVPQRRRRISVLADFNGHTAAEILFDEKLEREAECADSEQAVGRAGDEPGPEVHSLGEGLSGDSESGKAAREEAAGGAGGGAYPTIANTLTARHDGSPQPDKGNGANIVVQPTFCIRGNCIDRADTAGCNGKGWTEDVSYTLNSIDRPAVYDARGNGDGKTCCTLTGDHQNRVTDYTALCVGNGQLNQISMSEKANTLDTMHDQQAVLVPEVAHTLKAKGNCDMREDSETYVCQTVVRRLTPLEAERLQGLPDGWTNIGDWTDERGKIHHTSDSARYKAIGNGLAIPFWHWLLRRISGQYVGTPTLGGLFSGIGGFELCWERINGRGSVKWVSEIEPFAVAVLKKRFAETREKPSGVAQDGTE